MNSREGSKFQGHDATAPPLPAHIQHSNEGRKQVICFLPLHTEAIWTLCKSVSRAVKRKQKNKYRISSNPLTDIQLLLKLPSSSILTGNIMCCCFKFAFHQFSSKRSQNFQIYSAGEVWLCGLGHLRDSSVEDAGCAGESLLCGPDVYQKKSIYRSVSAVLTVAGSTPRA